MSSFSPKAIELIFFIFKEDLLVKYYVLENKSYLTSLLGYIGFLSREFYIE